MRAQEWSLDFLADYIINNNHQYIKDTTPDLLALSDKVKWVHGEHHPELLEIDKTINGVAHELMTHLQKEEQMLFPAIKEMVKGKSSGNYPFASISHPIQMIIRTRKHNYRRLPAVFLNVFKHAPRPQ